MGCSRYETFTLLFAVFSCIYLWFDKWSDIDSAKAEMKTLEKTIQKTSERLVSGVVFKYGKDSREYEMIGGVRTSDACGGLRLRIRKATIYSVKIDRRLKSGFYTDGVTSNKSASFMVNDAHCFA
ncbi:hypothetical protein [Nostoc sp. 106C]|uniref:hypothetical protein n=1 Tax=Nostoc sp. 106C TaxID=1932667 RepID=UPI001FB6ADC0|nr:hypothetical protein [Nostoc sp. 106C]